MIEYSEKQLRKSERSLLICYWRGRRQRQKIIVEIRPVSDGSMTLPNIQYNHLDMALSSNWLGRNSFKVEIPDRARIALPLASIVSQYR